MKRYFFLVLCWFPVLVNAEIYKAVDEDGHVTYSSSPIKGSKKLHLDPLPTMVPPSKANNFPKVDRATQKDRDDKRFMILQNELTNEEKLLEEAQKNLEEAQSNPEVYRGQDGRTYRNVAKYQEKTKPLEEEVNLHQKNIEALKTELSKLK